MLKQQLESKFTTKYEFKDLSSMNLTHLFGKLQEQKMDMKRLTNDKEGDENKKKGPTLKVTNVKNTESEDKDF